jgi:two-component system, OmpR family, sensor histidine kinase KdpD
VRTAEHPPGLAAYAVTLAGVAAISFAMWIARPYLTLAPIALVHLLAVFCAAMLWGMGPAIAASVLGFVVLDYLFIPPFFSLTIAAPSEVVSLVIFLAVAAVTSRLAAWARGRAREAEAHARESRALLRLSDAAVGAPTTEAALQAIAELTTEVFAVRHCAVLLPDGLGVLRLQARAPAADFCAITRDEEGTAAYVWRHQTFVPHASTLYAPLRIGARRVGVLRVGPRIDGQLLHAAEQRLLHAFAAGAAAAIDRRELLDVATQAEVLRRTDALKTALLGSVSHDLRTPLATLKTGITALLEDHGAWDRQTQREVLAAANEEVDRLTRLIGNLLDLSRIEAGVLLPDRQWYQAGELIADTVRRAALRNHRVTVDVSDLDMPVYLDYVQIQQVLANLLDNAAKYAPAGTEIRVLSAVEDGAFVIRVRDQGPGIPAAEADRVFSKFYRIGGRRTGTGLGLAICKGLVEAHGGRIALENPGREGAAFAVSLPLVRPPVFAGSSA